MGANQSTRKITVVNDEVSGVIKISDAVVQRLKGEISGESPAPAPAPAPALATAPEPAPEPAPAPAPSPDVAPPPVVVPAPPPAVAPPAVEEPKPAPPPPEPKVETPPPPPPAFEPAPPTPAPELLPPPPAAAPIPPQVLPLAPLVAEVAPTQVPPPPPHVWQRPIIQYIEEPSLSALRVRAEKEEELKKLEEYWKDRLQKQQDNHIANAKLTEEEILKSSKHVETLFKPASAREICSSSQLAVQNCYSENPSQSLLCREKVLEFSSCVAKSRMEMLTPSG